METYDLLLTRYPSIEHVFNMNVEDGAEMIVKAYEKQAEEKAWSMYLTLYPNMDEKNFVPFDRYYNPNRGKQETKTKEEILLEVKSLLDGNEWG